MTMAQVKTAHPNGMDESLQDSVFLRLLNLPMISSTREVMERTYTRAKSTHPLFCSVCEVYEWGAQTTASMVAWSVQPAIHRLEPQIEAVNSLACRGLDQLEKMIPALQYPPDKLASVIAEGVVSAARSAQRGVAGTLSLAVGGSRLTRGAVRDGVSFVTSSRPVRLAAEGADTALTLTEYLVSYVLPASDRETEEVSQWEDPADGESPACQPGYRRLGSLAGTVCRRAYNNTATQLHRTGSQSRQLVMSIPGVTPLMGVASRNLELAGGVVLGLPGSMGGLLVGMDKQTDKERRKKKEGKLLKSGGLLGVVSGVGRQLQSAYVSVVRTMKNTPTATLGLAREGTDALLETLGSARQHLLETAAQYGLLPGQSPEGGVSGTRATIVDDEDEEGKALCPSETIGRGF